MNFLYVSSVIMTFASSIFAQGGPSGSSMGSFIPMMLVMFVVIYFFMIRPEQKKQKEKKNMLGNIKKGNKVLTIGGIYGTVDNVKDEFVLVRIGDNNNKVKFTKSAITTVITNKEDTKKAVEEKKA